MVGSFRFGVTDESFAVLAPVLRLPKSVSTCVQPDVLYRTYRRLPIFGHSRQIQDSERYSRYALSKRRPEVGMRR